LEVQVGKENFLFADVKFLFLQLNRHVTDVRKAHCSFHGSWNQ